MFATSPHGLNGEDLALPRKIPHCTDRGDRDLSMPGADVRDSGKVEPAETATTAVA